jgi:hypothetical protein
MAFDLLEFQKRFKYYWWLGRSWEDRNKRPSWGRETIEPWPWPTLRVPHELPYPQRPPLNRKCHEGNIHQTILAEYDTIRPDSNYLELYFQVYHSISNRIILKITRKGLEDAKNKKYDEKNIVQTITTYLPSGLPVDKNGFLQMAKTLRERRKKEYLEEEAQKQFMYLSCCLICRGIELVLKTSELNDNKKIQGSTQNDRMKIYKNAENWKTTGKKRTRSEGRKEWANRMDSVKLIYYKIQEWIEVERTENPWPM